MVLINRFQQPFKAPALRVAMEQVGDAFPLEVPGFRKVKMPVGNPASFQTQKVDYFFRREEIVFPVRALLSASWAL